MSAIMLHWLIPPNNCSYFMLDSAAVMDVSMNNLELLHETQPEYILQQKV